MFMYASTVCEQKACINLKNLERAQNKFQRMISYGFWFVQMQEITTLVSVKDEGWQVNYN